MKNESIQVTDIDGAYTAIITPMHHDGSIHYEKLEQLIEDQIKAKVDGIVACGTTGQSATLMHDEHIGLAEWIYDRIDGRTRFIAGAGSNNTAESILMAQEIERRVGPTTFLMVTGYYNNPPQEGLIAHFNKISNEIGPGSNIIMYNVPGRTGSNLEAQTTIELSKNNKIIGIKEASGRLEQVEEIISFTDPDEFRVLSGEDHLVDKIIKMGGYGVISATMNVAPGYFKRMTDVALGSYKGLANGSDVYQSQILPLVKQGVFAAKNPIPLAMMFNTNVRLPLVLLPQIDKKVMSTLEIYTPRDLGINIADYR